MTMGSVVDRAARVMVVALGAARASLSTLLRAEGHEVLDPPAAGRAVVDAVVASRADLVLLDAAPPIEVALAAISDLRMMDEGRLVPVVLFAQDALCEQTIVRGLLAGADDFCAGGRTAELLARVRVQLRNRRDRELLRVAQRERSELLDAAKTDPLTGLGNRRAADEGIHRALSDAETLLLMVVDVDHFKRVNDTWGHAMGDAVLRAMGCGLRRMARDGDQLARYGGEEFIVLIRDAPPDRHEAIAERFLAGIRRIAMPPGGPERVTASIGAASWTKGDLRGAETLFKEADGALYAAKAAGRDQLVCAWRPHQAGVLLRRSEVHR